MRKANSKKSIKIITVAVLVFGIGVAYAMKTSGTVNLDNNSAKTVVAASNMNNPVAVAGVSAEVETETQSQVTEEVKAVTEETTEVQTETAAHTVAPAVEETQPVEPEIQKEEAAPVIDSRVSEVIAGINAERAAAGVAPVVYDATLTSMAQTRASENADNNFFVVENGKHMRPDGRTASSICTDYGVYGYFGEVMGRNQTSPAEIVTGWHDSAPHYACMTGAKYNRVGVGVAADAKGNLYWVAIFMD